MALSADTIDELSSTAVDRLHQVDKGSQFRVHAVEAVEGELANGVILQHRIYLLVVIDVKDCVGVCRTSSRESEVDETLSQHIIED